MLDRRLVAALLLAAVAASGAGAGERERASPTPVDPERARAVADGRELYRAHCRSCHGEGGHGDGPMADLLRVPPGDLTQIRRRHGGTFPSAEMQLVIDGRKDVRGHGGKDMPVWGLTFLQRGNDSAPASEAASRIRSLVLYLESIQAEARR